MAFGFKAEEIIPMLTNLGDAASGLGLGTEGVSRLAYALGQMQTSGKLNAQDMMQLTSAGISAWDMLAQAAGKICGEQVSFYPPGIPVLLPGELVTEEIIAYCRAQKELGLPVSGPADSSLQTIRIIAD